MKSEQALSTLKERYNQLDFALALKEDIPELLQLYQEEDLDVRRLAPCSQEEYSSLGPQEVRQRWEQAKKVLEQWVAAGRLSTEASEAILKQAEGIQNYQPIPPQGTLIGDPFNMQPVEKAQTLEELQQQQLENILVLKIDGQIASSARVLYVEGSWEIVSIVTRSEYRGQGLAAFLIQQALARFTQRPLYSFQTLDLVSYYLRQYQSGSPEVCPFSELPAPLQRDLFWMNLFWGPNVIIRINS